MGLGSCSPVSILFSFWDVSYVFYVRVLPRLQVSISDHLSYGLILQKELPVVEQSDTNTERRGKQGCKSYYLLPKTGCKSGALLKSCPTWPSSMLHSLHNSMSSHNVPTRFRPSAAWPGEWIPSHHLSSCIYWHLYLSSICELSLPKNTCSPFWTSPQYRGGGGGGQFGEHAANPHQTKHAKCRVSTCQFESHMM